jgi:hypothetical protein
MERFAHCFGGELNDQVKADEGREEKRRDRRRKNNCGWASISHTRMTALTNLGCGCGYL